MKNLSPFLLIVLAVLGCTLPKEPESKSENTTSSSAATPSTSTADRVKATPPPKPTATRSEPESGVTLANFQRLKNGMTYSEVVRVIGAEGELLSESEFAGTTTEMYQWKAGMMANMNAIFQNGKMVSKAQFGLD